MEKMQRLFLKSVPMTDTLEAFKKLSSEIKVTGVDASPKMIEICKKKY